MSPIRCVLCNRVHDERTGEPIHPELVTFAAGWTCGDCNVAANQRSLEAWRRLTPDERAGAATREERGK